MGFDMLLPYFTGDFNLVTISRDPLGPVGTCTKGKTLWHSWDTFTGTMGNDCTFDWSTRISSIYGLWFALWISLSYPIMKHTSKSRSSCFDFLYISIIKSAFSMFFCLVTQHQRFWFHQFGRAGSPGSMAYAWREIDGKWMVIWSPMKRNKNHLGSKVIGVPQARWMVYRKSIENPNLKWMMTQVPPIFLDTSIWNSTPSFSQWIGLRENLQETMDFPIFSMGLSG